MNSSKPVPSINPNINKNSAHPKILYLLQDHQGSGFSRKMNILILLQMTQ